VHQRAQVGAGGVGLRLLRRDPRDVGELRAPPADGGGFVPRPPGQRSAGSVNLLPCLVSHPESIGPSPRGVSSGSLGLDAVCEIARRSAVASSGSSSSWATLTSLRIVAEPSSTGTPLHPPEANGAHTQGTDEVFAVLPSAREAIRYRYGEGTEVRLDRAIRIYRAALEVVFRYTEAYGRRIVMKNARFQFGFRLGGKSRGSCWNIARWGGRGPLIVRAGGVKARGLVQVWGVVQRGRLWCVTRVPGSKCSRQSRGVRGERESSRPQKGEGK
jgi:hypothetical protein